MVIRKIAEMLGFYPTSFERKSRPGPKDEPPYFNYVYSVPKSGDLYRRGRHYHVTVGDNVYFWHGASRFIGPVSDTYFNTAEEAQDFFTALIVSCMPDFLDEDDILEAYEEFLGAIDFHIDNFEEMRPRDGIYFQPMELRLLVCDSCIPILNN
jgi:hypothetical protein